MSHKVGSLKCCIFKGLKRLLHITNVFEFSRLFHIQWRKHPAVAEALSIINAYKRRAVLIAQNSDVAPTTVGVAYLRFMKNARKSNTCALYIHYRHIYACNKNLVIHKLLFCRSQTRNFVECDPGQQKIQQLRNSNC